MTYSVGGQKPAEQHPKGFLDIISGKEGEIGNGMHSKSSNCFRKINTKSRISSAWWSIASVCHPHFFSFSEDPQARIYRCRDFRMVNDQCQGTPYACFGTRGLGISRLLRYVKTLPWGILSGISNGLEWIDFVRGRLCNCHVFEDWSDASAT